MKYLFLIGLAGAVAYFLFIRPKSLEHPETPAEPAREAEASPATKSPESNQPLVSTPMPADSLPPEPPPKRLAPEGTYYLIQRVAVATDSGMAGIAPGTKVTTLSPGPPWRVTDGKLEFNVAPGQVTNDLDVAARVYQAVSHQQSQVVAMTQRQSETARIENAERAKQHAAIGEAETRRARALLELRSRLAGAAKKEAALQKTVADMRGAYYSRGTYNARRVGWEELCAVEGDLQRVTDERRDIENQIVGLQK